MKCFISSVYSPFLLLVQIQLIENRRIHWSENHTSCFSFLIIFLYYVKWIQYQTYHHYLQSYFQCYHGRPACFAFICQHKIGSQGLIVYWDSMVLYFPYPHNNIMLHISKQSQLCCSFYRQYYCAPFCKNFSLSYFDRILGQVYDLTVHLMLL